MTEEEWLASTDPLAMCDFVSQATTSWKTRWLGWLKSKRFKVSERRWRLLELACCERLARHLPHSLLERLMPRAAKHAEGLLSAREHADTIEKIQRWIIKLPKRAPHLSAAMHEAAICAATAIGRLFAAPPGDGNVLQLVARAMIAGTMPNVFEEQEKFEHHTKAELSYQVHFVRDVLGNPFRATVFAPEWRHYQGGIVEQIARQIDEERAYRELPILGDALEEAGCDNDAILTHCRVPGEHVRGCWVVDRVLGRI
jgi:hypothetical protein